MQLLCKSREEFFFRTSYFSFPPILEILIADGDTGIDIEVANKALPY